MKTWICGEFRGLAHWYNFERLRNSTNTGIIGSRPIFVWVPSMHKCARLIRGIRWNALKSMWKRLVSCDAICIYFLNAPKSKDFNFGRFCVWVTCFSIEMPHFKLLEDLEMPQFSYFQNQMGNMEHFKDFERLKVGHFEEKVFKQKKDRNWNPSILGHFKNKCKSHDKNLLHMLFGSFHGTPHITKSTINFR